MHSCSGAKKHEVAREYSGAQTSDNKNTRPGIRNAKCRAMPNDGAHTSVSSLLWSRFPNQQSELQGSFMGCARSSRGAALLCRTRGRGDRPKQVSVTLLSFNHTPPPRSSEVRGASSVTVSSQGGRHVLTTPFTARAGGCTSVR